MDRQDAKDARGLEEPAGEVDEVASSVLQACVELRLALNFNVPVLFRGVRRVVLFAP
jgi:hypothetical protein